MAKFGEVLVKEPSCRCFNGKGSAESGEELLSIRIAGDESQLQCVLLKHSPMRSKHPFVLLHVREKPRNKFDDAPRCCSVWIEDNCLITGKGHLKFTYSFQNQVRTTDLLIRALKVVPHRDPQDDNVDCNYVCKVYLSLKDFRALQNFNNSFLGRLQNLLTEVENHREFTNQEDLIKKKLEDYSLAIYPDEEGFLLFKCHHEYTRPVNVLLRIDPLSMSMELCFPRSHLLLSTLSHESIPVASLQEAIDEFSLSSSGWPVVRIEEHGGDWPSIHPRFPSTEQSEEQDTFNSEEAHQLKHTEPFLNDTVRELHKPFSTKDNDCTKDENTKWEEESVRSLVRQVVHLRWQEHFSFYITVEKATLAILGRFESTAEVFVDAVSRIIWTSGSDSLCVYKLLVAAVDIPVVKRAILKKNLLCLLLRQYELMTQIIFSSTSSGSYNSHSTLSETHMEIGEMQYFTCPQTGEHGTTLHLPNSPNHASSDVIWTQTSRTPTSSHQVLHSGSEGTLSTLSLDLIEAPQSYSTLSNVSRTSSLPETKDQRQDVPKLSFYWLIKHEGTRSSTNTGTTRTTISLPDGRSIVFGDERGGTDSISMPLRGSQPAQHFTLTQGNEEYERFLQPTFQSTSITRTLLAWGMKNEQVTEPGFGHSVAYTIKCTLFEIFCTFSPLNLDEKISHGLEHTRDYRLLFGDSQSVSETEDIMEDDIRHPATLAVVELLAPPWQVFPGEQPPIRWGPTTRGSHLALAVLHEFACRPLHEVDVSDKGTVNIRLFVPQDLTGGSYHSLIGGVKRRIAQIATSSRIVVPYIEEATSLINLLSDFASSSPSSSQAPLVAYSCSDVFVSMETAIFGITKVSGWKFSYFRAFHALLRLYRCILERASDVVLIDFLISSLLERISWVKLVKEFSRAVLFSEKLEKKCDPEELACLRLGVWSYHTALVKVVAHNQREGESQDTGNLPQDFQDSKPAVFGQDPLDFLDYLFVPNTGFASQVLKRRNWAFAQSGPPLGGGLHAQVLLFLKILFSIPNNEFMRQHDISSFYLDLHWMSFKKLYVELNGRKEGTTAVICRLHLEVLRVIMKHHTLDIFAYVRKLGIISCLADEIALEASKSQNFSNFDPPSSQLTLAAVKAESSLQSSLSQGKFSDTDALDSSGQHSLLSSSAQWLETSKAFSTMQESLTSAVFNHSSEELDSKLNASSTANIQPEDESNKASERNSRRKKHSSRSSQESIRKMISKPFSFRSSPRRSRGSPSKSRAQKHVKPAADDDIDGGPLSSWIQTSRSHKLKTQRALSRAASNRNTPSRIPKIRNPKSPYRSNKTSVGSSAPERQLKGKDSVDAGISSSEGCRGQNHSSSPSSLFRNTFPLFATRKVSETRIPRAPSQEKCLGKRPKKSQKSSSKQANDEKKKSNSLQVLTNLFPMKKKASTSNTSTSNPRKLVGTASKKAIKVNKENSSKGRKVYANTGKRRGILFSKKVPSSGSQRNNISKSIKSKKVSNIDDEEHGKQGTKEKTAGKLQTKPINRTAKPVDGPSRLKIPSSPNRIPLSVGSSSASLNGRDSPLSYGTSTLSGRSQTHIKPSNVPLLNLACIRGPTNRAQKPAPGQLKVTMSNVSIERQMNGKTTRVNADRLDFRDKLVSCESSSRTQKDKAVLSGGQSSKSCSGSRGTYGTDECSDVNGPPTFGVYCGARGQEREIPNTGRETDKYDSSTTQSKKPPLRAKTLFAHMTKAVSSVENQMLNRCFETPSDFECSGNVAEDCKKVELLERAFYGLSSATFSSDSHGLESSVEEESIKGSKANSKDMQTIDVTSSIEGTKSPTTFRLAPSCIVESSRTVKKESVVNSQGSIRVSILKSETSVIETTNHEWIPNMQDSSEKGRRALQTSSTIPLESHQSERRIDSNLEYYEQLTEEQRQSSPVYFNSKNRLKTGSSSISDYQTPSNFEHVEALEQSLHGADDKAQKVQVTSSSSGSTMNTSEFDSVLDSSELLMTSVPGKTKLVPTLNLPVGKLNIGKMEIIEDNTISKTPDFRMDKASNVKTDDRSRNSRLESDHFFPTEPEFKLSIGNSQAIENGAEKSFSPKDFSPTDELSSFSWMHLSAKDSISESEFSRLINDGGNQPILPSSKKEDMTPPTNVHTFNRENTDEQSVDEGNISLSPYDAMCKERFIYSDIQLRTIVVEVLLEGMLLEYNTRAARDRDRRYPDVENITRFVPTVLKHHLNHKISEALVKILNEKLVFQCKNLHRLLRLFCHSFFPVDLYKSVDHLGRGAFSHVHRCDLPFEDAPESCAIKIMDHPVGHNEMSSLMDVYSEIYILEQFRDDLNVCSLYDYGVNKDSVFMVMKDYKCSLLEWRQKLPEQSAEALRLFLRIFQDIVQAVKKLHERNVVHFDLKCSNILLEPLPGISEEHFWNPPTEEPPFRVVLADFGEARSYNNDWEAKTVRNRGTEYNKSPEMLLIAKAQQIERPEYDRRKRIGAGPPSDVWALGCLLFELVTGEFLQLDTDWSRFFLRVTTNTMNVVDKEKQKMLPTKSRTVVGDLLDYILVRTHVWRPNLNMLSRKLETVMLSGTLGPYVLPRRLATFPTSDETRIEKISRIDWVGKINLPKDGVIAFSMNILITSIDCLLNPWFLSDKGISLLICVKGPKELEVNFRLRSTAARASIELMELCLEEEENIEIGHVDIIVAKLRSRKACFTCQSGYETKAMELILQTLQCREKHGGLESLMEIWRQLKL